jgi:hypothetical protein
METTANDFLAVLETGGLMAHTYLRWLTQRSLPQQPPGSKNVARICRCHVRAAI